LAERRREVTKGSRDEGTIAGTTLVLEFAFVGRIGMCIRFVSLRLSSTLADTFRVNHLLDDLQPSFNVAPTHNVAVVLDGPAEVAKPSRRKVESGKSGYDRQSYAMVLAEAIRFWIPKLPLQSQSGENLAHSVRLRTPRILLQSG
jgi:hypothetical protein